MKPAPEITGTAAAPPAQTACGEGDPEPTRTFGQPALGLAGLLFVVPIAVLLGAAAGGPEPSLRVLGPLSTFALPIVAMIVFWWHDWPASRFRGPLSPLLNVVLVSISAVLLTVVGQLVVGHLDLGAVFEATAAGGHSPTFPATMPLGGAFFVVTLQLTLVCERWPLDRLDPRSGGPVALLMAWAIALSLYLLLVRAPLRPGTSLYARSGGTISGREFGALLTAVGVWQVLLYVVLRGWPFTQMTARTPRLLLGNVTVIAAGTVTYLVLHGAAHVTSPTISAVAGSLLAAALLQGMLFDGLPLGTDHSARARVFALAVVALVAAVVYSVLTAFAHLANWTVAEPQEWVSYAGLNAIGLGVILHVGIGRRWPFANDQP